MSQQTEILAWLQAGQSLTPLDALRRFGCLRLGARVWDLKRAGHAIDVELVAEGGKHFARYRLAASNTVQPQA